MKLLKGFWVNLLIGLNVFILFFLVFESKIEVPSFLQVAGRMHPLLLHFPIVLLIVACLLEFFQGYFRIEKQAQRELVGFFLFSGALCSAVTVILGLFLSKEEGYSGDVLQIHKWTGVGVAFFASILLWAHRARPEGVALKAGMVLTFFCVLTAGHFGASLTHGEDFVLAPIASKDVKGPDLSTAIVYNDLVKPVLKEKCFSCHNPDKAKGELVMTDTASMQKGGENGSLFTTQKAGESLLLKRLLLDIDHKHRMPPKGKPQLSEPEIGIIKSWIEQGASFSAKLSDFPESSKIHEIAAGLYGGISKDIYDFAAADKGVVQQLNNSYRLIAPVAFESPALDVTFFNRAVFNKKALEEIRPVKNQVVHLNLSGMNVGDADLPEIAAFKSLRQLNLNYTAITDKGLLPLKELKQLHSLLLTGTDVTTAGLAAFLNQTKVRHIYAWNTEVLSQGADSLMAKYPGLQIETGTSDDGQVVLGLSAPRILPGRAFFRQPFLLQIDHPIPGTAIYYTLDGSEPDSLTSPRFVKQIRIDQNTMVKTKATKKGWAGSSIVERYFQRSSLLPDTAALVTFPDPFHKGKGIATLFDLEEGSTDIDYASDGKWLGYKNQEFAAELGFKEPVRLRGILLSTLVNVDNEGFPPRQVEVWAWNDGESPALIGKMQPIMPVKKKPKDKIPKRQYMLRCPIDANRPFTRFKIVAHPLEKLPAWHANAGKPSWFFIDEVLID